MLRPHKHTVTLFVAVVVSLLLSYQLLPNLDILRWFFSSSPSSFSSTSPVSWSFVGRTDTTFISIFHICFMSDKKTMLCIFAAHKQAFVRCFCAWRTFVVQLASFEISFYVLMRVCVRFGGGDGDGGGYQSGASKAQWCKCVSKTHWTWIQYISEHQ